MTMRDSETGLYLTLPPTAHSCRSSVGRDAAAQPVEGDIRRARGIQAPSNSNGLRTKTTFGRHLPMLAFADSGRALETLTRRIDARCGGIGD